jgi:hypothetical protein
MYDQDVFGASAGWSVLSGDIIENTIAPAVLQVEITDEILGGDIFGWLVDVFTHSVPTPIAALLVFGTIGLSYYMVQRTFVIPTVMLLIVGAVTVAEFPPTFQSAAVALAVIGFAVTIYVLFNRVRVT